MRAKYEIKYFGIHDYVPDEIRKEQDFHREDFYRFPILKFLYINDSPTLAIVKTISGIAEMIKDELVLLDFERGDTGMPRWNRNIRFASDRLKKRGLIDTIDGKWVLTIKGTLFYIYAKEDYTVKVIENHQNKWICNFDDLYKRFFPFTEMTEEKLRVSLKKRTQDFSSVERIINLYKNIQVLGEQDLIELEGLIQGCHKLIDDEKKDVLSYTVHGLQQELFKDVSSN